MKYHCSLNLFIVVNILLVASIVFSGCLSDDNNMAYQYDSPDTSYKDRGSSNLRSLMSGGSNVEILRYYPADSSLLYIDFERLRHLSPETASRLYQILSPKLEPVAIFGREIIKYVYVGGSDSIDSELFVIYGNFDQRDLKNNLDTNGYESEVSGHSDFLVYTESYSDSTIGISNNEILSGNYRGIQYALDSISHEQSFYDRDIIREQFDNSPLFVSYDGDDLVISYNEDGNDILVTWVVLAEYNSNLQNFKSEIEYWSDGCDGEIIEINRDEMNNIVGKVRINSDYLEQAIFSF